MARDPAATLGAGTFCASKVHKVGLALRNFSIMKSCLDAVVVLVALAFATCLQTCGAADVLLQNLLNAVLQPRTVHPCAVLLTQVAAKTQQGHTLEKKGLHDCLTRHFTYAAPESSKYPVLRQPNLNRVRPSASKKRARLQLFSLIDCTLENLLKRKRNWL